MGSLLLPLEMCSGATYPKECGRSRARAEGRMGRRGVGGSWRETEARRACAGGVWSQGGHGGFLPALFAEGLNLSLGVTEINK